MCRDFHHWNSNVRHSAWSGLYEGFGLVVQDRAATLVTPLLLPCCSSRSHRPSSCVSIMAGTPHSKSLFIPFTSAAIYDKGFTEELNAVYNPENLFQKLGIIVQPRPRNWYWYDHDGLSSVSPPHLPPTPRLTTRDLSAALSLNTGESPSPPTPDLLAMDVGSSSLLLTPTPSNPNGSAEKDWDFNFDRSTENQASASSPWWTTTLRSVARLIQIQTHPRSFSGVPLGPLAHLLLLTAAEIAGDSNISLLVISALAMVGLVFGSGLREGALGS